MGYTLEYKSELIQKASELIETIDLDIINGLYHSYAKYVKTYQKTKGFVLISETEYKKARKIACMIKILVSYCKNYNYTPDNSVSPSVKIISQNLTSNSYGTFNIHTYKSACNIDVIVSRGYISSSINTLATGRMRITKKQYGIIYSACEDLALAVYAHIQSILNEDQYDKLANTDFTCIIKDHTIKKAIETAAVAHTQKRLCEKGLIPNIIVELFDKNTKKCSDVTDFIRKSLDGNTDVVLEEYWASLKSMCEIYNYDFNKLNLVNNQVLNSIMRELIYAIETEKELHRSLVEIAGPIYKMKAVHS